MRETVNILGVNIDKITAENAVKRAEELLKTDGTSVIYTPNPEIIMAAYEDKSFESVLNSSDMCVPDGIGVVIGAKMVKTPLYERVAGFDLTCSLLKKMAETNGRVFLFGSKPNVAEKAGEKLKKENPGLVIAGCRNGYFGDEDDDDIVNQINEANADLLLVCLGAPKQEKWIYEHKNRLNVKLCIGAGGTLDVIAGEVKRAPDIFIKLNLEWFYRICCQPTRIGRFAALPKFVLKILKERKRK